MGIKDVKLVKGINRKEVNNLIINYIELVDDVFMGAKYKHNWRCKCGNIVEHRQWMVIRLQTNCSCETCKYNQEEQRYKYEVEKSGEYEYIKSFRGGDKLPNGKVVENSPYIQIKHKYCGSVYEIQAAQFINNNVRCGKCCQTYENSFAYHIERELNEPLDKYWDFEKNVVNPNLISKGMNGKNSKGENLKVWIKCTNPEKTYHGSYETSCNKFVSGRRCPYCNTFASNKVHPYDSFGYHNFDKVLSWHSDNKISPFRVAPNSNKKFKFICEDKECNHVWEASLNNINKGRWCPKCSSSKGEKKIEGWLRSHNFNYIHDEPYFKDLLSDLGNPLRPDFILPNHNIWIEYDGEFHYRDMYKDGSYEILKEHDKRKDKYAKNNGWKLIRIPYLDYCNTEEILCATII